MIRNGIAGVVELLVVVVAAAVVVAIVVGVGVGVVWLAARPPVIYG